MDALNISVGLLVGFVFGYITTLLVSYIRSRRKNESFDFIGASAIGVVVMAAITNFAFIGSINPASVGIILVGIQMIGFLPIFIIALPLAIVSRKSIRTWVKVLTALGAIGVCIVTIYIFSGACFSGVCRYIFPGQLVDNTITDQYKTEAWIRDTDDQSGFSIEYPPELTLYATSPATSERVTGFIINFSDNPGEGTLLTLDVNHNPNGQVSDAINLCNNCNTFAPSQPITIGGYPGTLNFLTDGRLHYLEADLKGQNEGVDFNVQLPFKTVYGNDVYALIPGDDAIVQDILTRMISTFKLTASFVPETNHGAQATRTSQTQISPLVVVPTTTTTRIAKITSLDDPASADEFWNSCGFSKGSFSQDMTGINDARQKVEGFNGVNNLIFYRMSYTCFFGSNQQAEQIYTFYSTSTQIAYNISITNAAESYLSGQSAIKNYCATNNGGFGSAAVLSNFQTQGANDFLLAAFQNHHGGSFEIDLACLPQVGLVWEPLISDTTINKIFSKIYSANTGKLVQ